MNTKASYAMLVAVSIVMFGFMSSIAENKCYASFQTGSTLKTKNIKTLDQALKAKVPVVVKLGSDSCYPCKMMKPILAQLAVEQDGKIIFLDLDVYENRELSRQAQVRVIPTILFYDRYGKPKGKSEGGMTKEQLLKTIKDLKL